MAWARTVTVTTSAQTVTLDGEPNWVEVTNVDGGGVLYFTMNGTTAVAEADDTIMVPANPGASVVEPMEDDRPEEGATISIIATSTSKVHLRGRAA